VFQIVSGSFTSNSASGSQLVPTRKIKTAERGGGAGAGASRDCTVQAALDLVAIGHSAVEGEVPVAVIGRRRPAPRRILPRQIKSTVYIISYLYKSIYKRLRGFFITPQPHVFRF